ncbi:MAG: NAD(P)-dependent oxidoreductase [Bdellovibrionales bacterium]|nr:NAD(P)-dependent oxidoreductase [Bdellovibrionales bacterium]
MKILLTGGTGFIGKHLITALRQNGFEVVVLARKNSDQNLLREKGATQICIWNGEIQSIAKIFADFEIAGVVHLASLYLKRHSSADVAKLVESNLNFSAQLIEAAAVANVPWFINTGTFWQHYQNAEYSPVNLYAATKQAFQALLQYYQETSDTTIVTLKLSDTYGREDVRPKIFKLWLDNAANGEVLEMTGGAQELDLVHVKDVVQAYLQAVSLLNAGDLTTGSVYAVSAPNLVSLKELAAKFSKVCGKELQIAWGARAYSEREVMRPWSQGKPLPGWKAEVVLEDGLRDLLQELVQ